jgi:hypothetical protein
MWAEWAARDEQPILLTSTNPCITRGAGTQGVKRIAMNFLCQSSLSVFTPDFKHHI